MHRIIETPLAQVGGYSVVSGLSMLMLSAQSAAVTIDPSGVLSLVPAWLIGVMWAITTIAFAANTAASAYKRTMEGRAALLHASKEVCTKEECPYRIHWLETRKSKV